MPLRQKTFISPLYTLRQRCRLTQPEFARLIGVAFDTVQSVETGRAKLTPGILEKVRYATGAVWKDKKSEWLLDWNIRRHLAKPVEDKETPFTAELFAQFQGLKTTPISKARLEDDQKTMHEWVDTLCAYAPQERWVEFVQRFSQFVQATLNAFPRDEQQRPAAKPEPRSSVLQSRPSPGSRRAPDNKPATAGH
jgi:transcriptional regulator with XRE-family HTH domain